VEVDTYTSMMVVGGTVVGLVARWQTIVAGRQVAVLIETVGGIAC